MESRSTRGRRDPAPEDGFKYWLMALSRRILAALAAALLATAFGGLGANAQDAAQESPPDAARDAAAAPQDAGPSGEAGRVLGRVTIDGGSALPPDTLQEALALKTGDPYSSGALATARARIEQVCHRDGFLLADVRWELEPGAGSRVDVVLRIREGRRVYLRDVVLEGASALSPSEVLASLETRTRRLYGIIARGYYVPEAAARDVERIELYYRSRGFLQAEASFGELEVDYARNEARATFVVVEGPRYRLRSVTIDGQRLFSAARLLEVGQIPTGGFFSGDEVDQGLRRILRWYEQRAQISPTLRVHIEPDTDLTATVVVSVTAESRRAVGRVTVRGNERTRDDVIWGDLSLRPGAPLTSIEIERSLRRLEERRLFESVDLKLAPAEAGAQDVELTVKERKQWGFAEAGGGASSGSGEFAYVRVTHDNLDLLRWPRSLLDWRGAFTGGAQKLQVEYIPGSKETELRLRFEEPHFLLSDQSLTLGGGPSILERRSYDEVRWQGAAEVMRYLDIDRTLYASAGFVGESVEIKRLDRDAPPDVQRAEGRTLVAYPRLKLGVRLTDVNYYSGPSGLAALASFDLGHSALGSQLDFLRVKASVDGHLTFLGRDPDLRHSLHAGVDFGWAEGFHGDELPIFERFFLGGPGSFPGFEYRNVGPRGGKTPLGGEALLHGTVDYSLPLGWREARAFGLFSWGLLEPRLSDLALGRIRTAVGGGLQIRLRLAGQPLPANLYWMKALSSEAGDKEQLFSFTVGVSF